jgi:hypothetical protein
VAIRGNGFGNGLVRRGQGVRGVNGAFALLDQPTGDQGVAVFVEPLVEEGIDFLAEIEEDEEFLEEAGDEPGPDD